MIKYIPAALLLLLWACSQPSKTEEATSTSTQPPNAFKLVDKALPETGQNTAVTEPHAAADMLAIQFDLFTLQFPGLSTDEYDPTYKNDTVEFWLDLIDNFSKQEVRISLKNNTSYDSLKLFESYRTTLSISNEGPHLDLYEWLGHESGWIAMPSTGPQTFVVKTLTEKEMKQFPPFTHEELIHAADAYSEGTYGELIRNPSNGSWKDAFWIGIGLRRIKVELYKAGKVTTRILEVYIPMGC